MLGTSRTNPLKKEEHIQQVQDNFRRYGLDALVAIGGDDTLSVAARLLRARPHTVGFPKTMDNDVDCTDYTIGFNSAVSIVADALDKLHTTASSHHRVLVVEVMGRDAGWVAVVGGMAGGADYIIVPEAPATVRRSLLAPATPPRARQGLLHHRRLRRRKRHRRRVDGVHGTSLDAFGHVRLDRRAIGEVLGRAIEEQTGSRPASPFSATSSAAARRPPSTACSRRALASPPSTTSERAASATCPRLLVRRSCRSRSPTRSRRNRTVDLELLDIARIFY